MPSVLSLILGGGRGTRLLPLTLHRSKPAVPVAGKYRLIDIPISNCINSGYNRIYVLTQFLSISLHRHISNTYKFDMFGRGFVEVLAAHQTIEKEKEWGYQGTADAVRQCRRQIEEDPADDVLILSGDQLYRMDFADLMMSHANADADATVAVLPVAREAVTGLGLVQVDKAGRITGFVEKPKTDAELVPVKTDPAWIESRGVPFNDRPYLASMGIYVFKKSALFELLDRDPSVTDFGKEIFPRHLKTHKFHVHLFDGYWEDLGTVKSFHDAHLALASDAPPFEFAVRDKAIYTRQRNLPASRVRDARLRQALVSDGCVVDVGSTIEQSVLGIRSRVGKNTTIRRTVIIGSDQFESDAERATNRRNGIPCMNVGDDCRIEMAILDKDCRVGNNVTILNEKGIQNHEGGFYWIRDGIVCIPKGEVVPDGTVI